MFLLKDEKRLLDNFGLVDLVLEVLDARLPVTSRNPRLKKLLGAKNRVIVLNKTDLAEKELTGCWLNYLAGEKWPVLDFNANSRAEVKRMEKMLETFRPQTGKFKRSFRMMAVGIPNVGKSTILNRLLQKYVARTGNTPGITRGTQWIKLRSGWDLLDTPGLLSPFIRNEHSILSLGAIGSLSQGAYDPERAACWLVEQFLAREKTRQVLEKLYAINAANAANAINAVNAVDAVNSVRFSEDDLKQQSAMALLMEIGKMRGCFKKGAEVDILKTSQILLSDFRRGVLGPITLEMPPADSVPPNP